MTAVEHEIPVFGFLLPPVEVRNSLGVHGGVKSAGAMGTNKTDNALVRKPSDLAVTELAVIWRTAGAWREELPLSVLFGQPELPDVTD